ncbi:MAG: transporter substrate-binding domain-containing protein [Pseudomonadota bacterium]
MFSRISQLLAATALCAAGSQAFAQSTDETTCGGTYRVQPGDTLSGIVDNLYDNSTIWSRIYQANASTIGTNPNLLRVGQQLTMPCIDNKPNGLAGGAVVSAERPTVVQSETITTATVAAATEVGSELNIRVLTAGDYAPFTQRGILNDGMLTDVVQNAMAESDLVDNFKIHWVEDWSAHLDPLLTESMLDMGFPWFKPDCEGDPSQYRCENFHFTDPMFEMLILLFAHKDRPMVFRTDNDMLGKTLCRPAGYFTHDMEKNGRNWVSEGKITLEQPATIKECFDMLEAGTVDAVAINEFTGRTAMKDLDLADTVEIVGSRPLSIEGLHVLVHKSHPRADEMLAAANAGLREIQESGVYQRIIDEHMTLIWDSF